MCGQGNFLLSPYPDEVSFLIVLPCLLLLIMPILATVGSTDPGVMAAEGGGAFGCVTAIGVVLVMVVMVAAGIIRVDIVGADGRSNNDDWVRLKRRRIEVQN